MQLRTAALLGLLGLGVGWTLSGRMPGAGEPDGARGGSNTGPRPLGVPPSVNVAPLASQRRRAAEQHARAPTPSRNPFVFGARSHAPLAPSGAAALPPEPSGTVIQPDEEPRPGSQLRLTGMATTDGPGGPERTAMIHDGTSLQFVKLGDTLPGGFQVVGLQDQSVTLRNAAGTERTLRLP